MHRVAKLLVVVAAFTAVGCSRVSSSEAKLIGEWSIPTGDVDDNGAYPSNRGFELTTFKADHTFSQVSHHTDLPPSTCLVWQLALGRATAGAQIHVGTSQHARHGRPRVAAHHLRRSAG